MDSGVTVMNSEDMNSGVTVMAAEAPSNNHMSPRTETGQGMNSGVTVMAAEAPSSYHMAPRTEKSPQVTATGIPPVAPSPGAVGSEGTVGKKKRGRPRMCGPDGAIARALSSMPIASSAPPATGDKRKRGRPVGSVSKPRGPQRKAGSGKLGKLVACSSGGNVTPHVINVNAGEDVTKKIISLSQQVPRAICIISAVGLISNVKLRQPNSSGGTLTYEGCFDIVSLSGSFAPIEIEGSRTNRIGGMSIALASPDGRIIGGLLAGLLTAASPVRVIVGSFLPSNNNEPKPKKQKPDPIPSEVAGGIAADPNPTEVAEGSAAMPPMVHTSNAGQNNFNSQDQSNSAAENQNIAPPFTLETGDWTTLPIVQDATTPTSDIDFPFQG